MFKNLKAEMIIQGVTIQDIATALGIQVDSARLKINGKVGIAISDCKKIAQLFTEKKSVDYLFDQ